MTPLLLTAALLQPAPRLDAYGDPLPPGALVRIGTQRLRPGDMVTSMAFTPDGKKLVTANSRTGVHVWDVATGKELHHLPNPEGITKRVKLSPDGSRVATQKRGGPWVVRAVADGAALGTVPSGADTYTLALTADGRGFADTAMNEVVLGEVGSAKEPRRAALPPDIPRIQGPVALSPIDNTVAVSYEGHPVSLHDFATGKCLRSFDQPAKGIGYRTVAFAPDGKQAAGVLYTHRAVDVWDVATGKCVCSLEGTIFTQTVLAFTADGRWLLTCAREPPVRVWDLATGKEVRTLAVQGAHVSCVAVSPDGKTVATAGDVVQLWDVTTGKELATVAGRLDGTAYFHFSGDGKRLVSQRTTGKAPDDQTAFQVWDAVSGKQLETIDWGPQATRAALSGDGRELAVAKDYNTVEVRLRAGGKCLFKLAPAAGVVDQVDLSPDGTRLVLTLRELVGTEEGRALVQLWDVAAGKLLLELEEAPRQLCFGAFSDDGLALVVFRGRLGGRLLQECYDCRAGRKLRRPGLVLDGDQSEFMTFGGPLAARFVLSGDTVHLHELATGQAVGRFTLPGQQVHRAALAPNGRLLAVATVESPIMVWDVLSGQEVARLSGHRGDILGLSWSPDGKRLLSYGQDATAIVWDASPWYVAANGQWTAQQLTALWDDLASPDGERGFGALAKLVQAPGPAAAFLKKQLRPATAAEVARIEALVADLGDVKLAVRHAAHTELAKLGELALPALEKALAARPTLEVRRRLDVLFEKMETPPTVPAALRPVRALVALEMMGTPEAWALLEELAAGDEGAWLTREARAALGRLAQIRQ